MLKKTTLIYIVLLLLTALTVSNMFNLTKKSKNQSTLSMVKMLKINEQLQFQNENKQIKKDILLTYGNNNNKIMLTALLNNDNPKLVFFYSQLNCQVCVNTEIKKLKLFSEKIGKGNIIIISSYKNKKDYLIFKKIHNLNLKIYNIGLKNTLGLPLENYNVPFLFIANSKFRTQNIFVPFKGLPSISDMYYDFILNKYFKNL